MTCKFEATWGSSYVEPGTKTVEIAFFDAGLGYDADDIRQISALAVGESVTLDAGDHVVTRIS